MNTEEKNYLNLLDNILQNGSERRTHRNPAR